MAKNLGFVKPFGNEGSSWADDDDDLDLQPLVIEPKLLPEVAENQPEEEAPARRDYDRADDRSRGGRGYDEHRRGGHDDRRGGYEDRRGGHDRNYDDRRGGSHDRDNYRSQRGGGRDGGDYVERPKNPVPDHPPYKIFVGNLPFRVNEDDLARFLGDEQTIKDIRFPKDFETNRPKGFAYVEFESREALVAALELDGKDVDGRAVKIDVASEKQPRQDRSGGFFEKRDGGSRSFRGNDRPSRDDRQEAASVQKERPRITLLPRNNTSTEQSDGSKKASIFGEAKPRDESAYLERQKAKELERKKAKEIVRKKSVDEMKPKAVDGEKKQGPPSRKNSHDDGFGFRAGGRGSARGGRGERPASRADSRGRGEHAAATGGRGGEHAGATGGRGGRHAPGSARKQPEAAASVTPAAAAATPAPASRKSEPRPKRTEPVKAKIAAPAPAKIVNTFSLLGADSDSD